MLSSPHAPRGGKTLRVELLWTLALKLALLVAIKLVFFSHPVSQADRQDGLQARLLSAPSQEAASAPTSPEKDSPHDQRHTR